MVSDSMPQFQKSLKDPGVRDVEVVVDLIKKIVDEEDDDPEPIKKILDAGECDVNAIHDDFSLLHWAVDCHHVQVLEYLTQHPLVDVNIRDSNGRTPLFYAVEMACIDSMRVLLEHKDIDAHARNSEGRSALSLRYLDLEVDRIFLLDERVDVNIFETNHAQRWRMQENGPPICLFEDCGNEMSLQTGGQTGDYEAGSWECDICEKLFSVNTPRYFCCDEHQNDICESCYPPGIIRKTTEWTIFHHRVVFASAQSVGEWLQRADLNVNKYDVGGCPPLFHCFDEMSTDPHKIDGNMMILDMLLGDERTILSFRNEDGQSVKDRYKHIFSLYADRHHEIRGRVQEALDIVSRHEQVRLQRAKIPVEILKDWCIETPTKTIHFPEEVLFKNVLPFIADVVSPVEEIGRAGLQ